MNRRTHWSHCVRESSTSRGLGYSVSRLFERFGIFSINWVTLLPPKTPQATGCWILGRSLAQIGKKSLGSIFNGHRRFWWFFGRAFLCLDGRAQWSCCYAWWIRYLGGCRKIKSLWHDLFLSHEPFFEFGNGSHAKVRKKIFPPIFFKLTQGFRESFRSPVMYFSVVKVAPSTL